MVWLQRILIAMALAIAALGLVGLAAPAVLLDLGRPLTTGSALYWVAAVRVGFGVLLLLVAGRSRAPVPLRVIGVLVVVAGVFTPFLGLATAAFSWVSTQEPLVVRLLAMVALAFGLFTAHAVNPPNAARSRA
jgi:hypothetical protein